MYVRADYGHHRWPAILRFLQSLSHGLLTLVLGVLTVGAGIVLGLVPWPFVGALSSVALQILYTQGTNLGVHLVYRTPGDSLLRWLDTYLFVGLILVMPALVYELLAAARPKLARENPSAAVLAVSVTWPLFLVGIVLGYALVVPVRDSLDHWRSLAPVSPSITGNGVGSELLAVVSKFPIWIGLFVELPVALYAMAKLGAILRVSMVRWRFAGIPIALLVSALLVGQDPINVALVAVPTYLPFELGLVLVRIAQPRAGERASA